MDIKEKKDVRQTLRHQLQQRIGVVGVAAHDVAVRVGIEIPERQGLHLAEHVRSDLGQKVHGNDGHQPRIEEGRDHAEHVDAAHDEYYLGEHGAHRAEPLRDAGSDDLVDENFEKYRGGNARRGRNHDTQHDDCEISFIIAEKIFHQPSEHAERSRAVFFFIHCPHPLSCSAIRKLPCIRGRFSEVLRACRRHRSRRRS